MVDVPVKTKVCLVGRLPQPTGTVLFSKVNAEYVGENKDGVTCCRCYTDENVQCFSTLDKLVLFGVCENCLRGLSVNRLKKSDLE